MKNKTSEHITKPKKCSEFRQVSLVFESEHCVDCSCRHLRTPCANNMAEVVYAVKEELAFLHIKRLICIVQHLQHFSNMLDVFVWRSR